MEGETEAQSWREAHKQDRKGQNVSVWSKKFKFQDSKEGLY